MPSYQLAFKQGRSSGTQLGTDHGTGSVAPAVGLHRARGATELSKLRSVL
jgi:hypothetical protein